jgi:ParB/RepB/Spo0J family partition protein
MQEQYRRIPLEQLRESPTNPRRFYAEQPLNELAQSIKQHGVLQAIITRPHPMEAEGFEIVCGSRRYRGTKLAQLTDIPAVVRDLTDEQVIAIQAIENIQREDVHPLEEASSYAQLVALGREVEDIAVQLGKSATYIYQRMKLAALTPEVQEAYLAGTFTTSHAIDLARLPASAQRELLEYIKEGTQYGDAVSVADLREEIERRYHLDLHRAPFKKSDAQLVADVGPCTTCPKRTGYTPALFPDIKRKDTCTDRECFYGKLAAHIERVQAEHADGDSKAPFLSSFYSSTVDTAARYPDALLHQKWAEATKKCKHTLNGVLVDSIDAGKVVPCCIEPSCTVHRAKVDSEAAAHGVRTKAKVKTPQQVAAQQRESAKRAAQERAIVATVAKTKELNGPDLKTVALALLTEMWSQHTKELFKARGWEPMKNKYGYDHTAAAADYIEKMSAAELSGLLLECALRGRSMNDMSGSTEHRLKEAVKRHGVDLQKLEKDALDEIKAKDKAKKLHVEERQKKAKGKK